MARSGIQLCYPFEEKRLEKWQPPYLIQPKLDGERCRAIYTQCGYILLSSEENLILSVPHITDALNVWMARNPSAQMPELDGELYRHGWSFEEIHSVVGRTANLHPHHEMLEFHVFDIVNEAPQLERLAQLRDLAKTFPASVKLVETRLADDLESLMMHYRWYLDHAYEGIIVRNYSAPYVRRRSTFVMKFKPKKEDTYGIVRFVEAVDQYGRPKNMLGAIICAGDDGTEFRAGAGTLTHDARVRYWAERDSWIGKTIRIQYQNLTERGVPRFGLCVDLIDQPFVEPPTEFFNPLLGD